MSFPSDDLELDYDRFIYEEHYEIGSYDPIITKVGCRHRPEALEPVTSVRGDVVAVLCVDCDQQLPAGWGGR